MCRMPEKPVLAMSGCGKLLQATLCPFQESVEHSGVRPTGSLSDSREQRPLPVRTMTAPPGSNHAAEGTTMLAKRM